MQLLELARNFQIETVDEILVSIPKRDKMQNFVFSCEVENPLVITSDC